MVLGARVPQASLTSMKYVESGLRGFSDGKRRVFYVRRNGSGAELDLHPHDTYNAR
jgi:hypothetical protein